MKRPVDPRVGLKEPQKVLSHTDHLYLSSLDKDEKVSLQTLVNAWHKILKDLESRGQRVTEGPYFDVQSYYGRSNRLTYTYEWDNFSYSVEKAEWDVMTAAYEIELAAWKTFEEERKKEVANASAKSIDDQIVRAEHRLANLKAAKAGEPIPYPKG